MIVDASEFINGLGKHGGKGVGLSECVQLIKNDFEIIIIGWIEL